MIVKTYFLVLILLAFRCICSLNLSILEVCLHSDAAFTRPPLLVASSLTLVYEDRKFSAHFRFPGRQLVFSDQQVFDVRFQTFTTSFSKLKLATKLQTITT